MIKSLSHSGTRAAVRKLAAAPAAVDFGDITVGVANAAGDPVLTPEAPA